MLKQYPLTVFLESPRPGAAVVAGGARAAGPAQLQLPRGRPRRQTYDARQLQASKAAIAKQRKRS